MCRSSAGRTPSRAPVSGYQAQIWPELLPRKAPRSRRASPRQEEQRSVISGRACNALTGISGLSAGRPPSRADALIQVLADIFDKFLLIGDRKASELFPGHTLPIILDEIPRGDAPISPSADLVLLPADRHRH